MAETTHESSLVVLVVEDEFFVRSSIAEFLQDAGHVVIEAATGERAIGLCNSGMPVDVVFTDIGLNGSSSGWAVAEAFRARRADIPVVYASGNAVDRSRRVAGSLFFNKPYQPAEILRACKTLCPNKR